MKRPWKTLVRLFLVALLLALAGCAAALAEERVGDVGTWMLVGRDRFWSKAPKMLVLESDGSITARAGEEEVPLSWVAGEDGSISKVESASGEYSAKVQEDFIVISRVWSGLETERAVYRYMFDASGARIPDPEYGDSGFAGVWKGRNLTLTLAPNGNGQRRTFYFWDDIDYEDVWWHPLSDGSGIRLLRLGTGVFEDVPLENGALQMDEIINIEELELTDDEINAEQFQNYPSLTAAPTPAPSPTPAPEIHSDGTFEYYVLEDGIEIVRYLENRAQVTVPEEIDGKPVVRIGSYAFSQADMLINVTVPGCVKEIASYAFYECPSLSTVRIQSGVETIKEYAFYDCGRLGWVRVPETVNAIGNNAFLQDAEHDDTYIIVERDSYAEHFAETRGIPYSILPPDAEDVPEELDFQPGNVVRFAGTEWLVLLREDGRAMLLRWEALPMQKTFDSDKQGTRWRDSNLRAWLNIDYLNSFDEQELAIIEKSLTITKPNRDSDLEISDPPTVDRAFLPDYYEIEELMQDEASRVVFLENGTRMNWWLRTDGATMKRQLVVNEDGSISSSYDSNKAGVRPAICVDLTRANGLVEFAAESVEAMYAQTFSAIMEQLSGDWIRQSGGEEGNRASTLTLNADGTGSYVCADVLAAPSEIYASYDFHWTFERNILIERNGEQEMLGLSEDSIWLPSTSETLYKLPQYDAMMQSAQENSWTTLDALLGVWEVQSAEADGCKYIVSITLQPDGGALLALRSLRLSDDSVVEKIETERSCPWVMTPGGIRITLPEGDREIGFGDGTITVDSVTLPVVKAADLSRWQIGMNGGQYVYSAYHDFSDSGYIGVWEYNRIVDEYDNIRGEIYLCLARDGSGAIVDVYSGKNIAIEWAPSDRGVDVASLPGEMELLDIGLHEGEKNTLVKREEYLEWSTTSSSGILSFEKIEDNFEPGEVYQPAPAATPMPTLEPAPDPATIQAGLPQPNREVTSASSALEMLPVTQFMSDMDVFEFVKLLLKYVSNSEMEPDGANQAFTVYLQHGVSIGGSKGYAQNWVSEGGVLCDAALDLDGDGQEECLLYEVEGQVDDGYDYSYYKPIGHLVVYDSRDGEYVETDRVEILGSLMPEGDSEIRIVNTDSGIYIADVYIKKWYETETQVTMNLYRYDGESFQRVLSADISDSSNSALVSGSYIVKDLSRDLNLWEISDAVSRYDSDGDPGALEDLGLTIGENLLLSFISENESGMPVRDQTVFETLNAELAAYGLNLAYVTSDRGSETGIVGQIIESIQLDGGEIFLSAIDSYSSLYTGEGDVRLVLCTSLDHRPGVPEDEETSGSDGTTAYYADDYYDDYYMDDDYYDDDYYVDAYYMDDYSTAAYD